ncbi:MAG: LacI family DNA-binding transcriptional regulator [Acidimicrobiia bacterium]|nr:LacI family DNA-binding transcriptional regulator [Acidimicrobiia bacterium]
MTDRRLNLEEIGRMAGVSRSTVSRVVNGAENVSDEARARVESVIAATGYRPHAAARSLASNRTGVVGLVIPSAVESLFADPYFGRLIYGISTATYQLGKTLSLFIFKEESEEDAIYSRVVGPGLVDGVIVTATRMGDSLIQNLTDAEMPFVVVGRPDAGRPAFSVDADNRGGARTAAEHLASLGYREVGMITAPSNTTAGIDRRAGFLDGASDVGLSIDNRIVEGDWSERSGREAMAQLLSSSRPEAVFVASDRMATGALRAIREAGLVCPDDIALVSFDGLVPPDHTVPSLTSVAQPVAEVGTEAANMLDAVITGELDTPESVVLPTRLLVRESCGAALRKPAT